MNLQLLMTATEEIDEVDGVECRRWTAVAPNGGALEAWVRRVHPLDDLGRDYVEPDLIQTPDPSINPRVLYVDEETLRSIACRYVLETVGVTYASRSEESLARQVKTCFEDGETILAACLILLINARTLDREAEALSILALGLADYGIFVDWTATAGNAERAAGG